MIYAIGREFKKVFVSILFDVKLAQKCYGDYHEYVCLKFENNTAIGIRVIQKHNEIPKIDYIFLTEDDIKTINWNTSIHYKAGYWDCQINCFSWYPIILSLLVPGGKILYRKEENSKSIDEVYLENFYTTNVNEAVKLR